MSPSKLMSFTPPTFTGVGSEDLVIGIDPGVTRLGLHAEVNRTPVANATYASDADKDYNVFPNANRVWSLAQDVVVWVDEKQGEADGLLVIAIETPIFNGRNPKAFELQWRLFQEIVHALTTSFKCTIIEVNNKTAKKCATGDGNADKMDVICASPYDGPGPWNAKGTKAKADYNANQEAIADAWAIAQCCYGPKVGVRYTDMQVSMTASRGPIVEDVLI